MANTTKLAVLTLSALLVTNAAYSMRFSATINKLKLPLFMSTEQPPQIKYVPPGNINVTSHRMCGDGDVSNFSSSNPEFDFVPSEQSKLDVLIGYWIVEDGASDIQPSSSNWYPVAYKGITIASSPATVDQNGGRFLPFSHSKIDASMNAMQLIRNELLNLNTMAKGSFNVNKNYRIFAAALTCVEPDESSEMVAEGEGDYTPSPVDAISSLSGIEQAAGNAVDSGVINEVLNTTKKIKIQARSKEDVNSKAYSYSFGNQGVDLNNNLYDLYKSILDTDYPATATDVDAYKAAVGSVSYKSSVSGYTGDKIDFCNAVGASSSKTAKTYDFEPFPLNLACKNLFGGTALDTAYRALFSPTEKPSLNDFNKAKKDLAKRFLVASGYVAAQQHLNSKKIIRTGCFKKSGQTHLISRIVGSYPFKFTLESKHYALKPNANNHLHPESLFALHDYQNYFNSDILAIFGQVTPSQGTSDPNQLKNNGIYFPLSNPSQIDTDYKLDTGSFTGAPLNINFKVRSVGGSCSGTFFC